MTSVLDKKIYTLSYMNHKHTYLLTCIFIYSPSNPNAGRIWCWTKILLFKN